jgi:hypothetical protein
MNSHNKRAGESTRKMANKRYKSRVWFILITIGVLLLILVLFSNWRAWGISGFGVLILIVLFRLVMDYADAKTRRMVKKERRAVRGARAEEKIGSILDSLGDGYFVLLDIASPYGNIDHIVISKSGGVFLIETKAHGGKVSLVNGHLLVNGHDPEKDFIAQALKNTYWLRDTIQDGINIQPWITPILVFTNAFVERAAPVKGVMIINKKYLPAALQKPNTQASNLAAWESREKIQEMCTR